MTDYWLSKMFYELQQPQAAVEYRADRVAVMARYPLRPEVREAVLADDVPALSHWVNAYLLRFYCSIIGMSDATFISRIRAAATEPAAQ